MNGFNSLEFFFKREFLRKSARFVISVRYFQYTVGLFTWNRFLFEQYYNHDKGRITLIRIAEDRQLKKFIKEIDISDLGRITHL